MSSCKLIHFKSPAFDFTFSLLLYEIFHKILPQNSQENFKDFSRAQKVSNILESNMNPLQPENYKQEEND